MLNPPTMHTEVPVATSASALRRKRCPKCGTAKKSGKLSCCARGGSWFRKCGDALEANFDHTWVEGIQACKRKFQTVRCVHCNVTVIIDLISLAHIPQIFYLLCMCTACNVLFQQLNIIPAWSFIYMCTAIVEATSAAGSVSLAASSPKVIAAVSSAAMTPSTGIPNVQISCDSAGVI